MACSTEMRLISSRLASGLAVLLFTPGTQLREDVQGLHVFGILAGLSPITFVRFGKISSKVVAKRISPA